MSDRTGQQAPNAWRVLTLLFLANLINFFDRTLPAIVAEPIRLEWGLSDLQLGLLTAAFTVIYAVTGLPLGRLADRLPRRRVMAWGLAVWSGFTALNGLAWSYLSFFVVRMGVGIGEASCAPAANSLIGDLFPADKRARATGIYMLGLPLGLVLAFFTVGPMIEAFGSWRAPFLVAAVPGFVLAIFLLKIREPMRGASEVGANQDEASSQHEIDRPIRRLLGITTLRWLILSGVTANFAAYAGNAFLVPLLQRYFELSLTRAAVLTGCIVGVTGLIGLTASGSIADRLHARSDRGRLRFGAISLVVAAMGTGLALLADASAIPLFAWPFALGWLAMYSYYTCVNPAILDVVEPRLRATAVAVYFAGMYLLGGAFGPVVVGFVSDALARRAAPAGELHTMTEELKAIGLHGAMVLIPISLLLTAFFIYMASRSFPDDERRMHERLAAGR